MAKKKSKVKHSAKKTETKTKVPKASKPIIPMDTNSLITYGIFLLVGLLVGMAVMFAVSVPTENSVTGIGTDLSSGMDINSVQLEAEEYIKQNLLNPQEGQEVNVVLKDGKELGNGVYEFMAYIEAEGQLIPSAYIYATKDNIILSQSKAFNLDEPIEKPEPTEQPVEQVEAKEWTEEQKAEIISFNDCLAEKGIKIYGANWCGYTKALVENLGGFELVNSVYVECTEDEELCAEKNIAGYPTILLDGEKISPARNFEGLSEATGCIVPSISDTTTTQTGSC
jgi:hypothetical protein